jgi:hypothetical protein
MAVVKIHEIVLYTTSAMNPIECHDAKAWLDHSGIQFINLHYNDPEQLPQVISALNTWWEGKQLSQWPFVVYKEQHDDRPITQMLANFIEGVDNIKNQLPALASL